MDKQSSKQNRNNSASQCTDSTENSRNKSMNQNRNTGSSKDSTQCSDGSTKDCNS